MSNLVWLKLNTPEGKPVLVCANNISHIERIASPSTGTLIWIFDHNLVIARETLEEIAKLLE